MNIKYNIGSEELKNYQEKTAKFDNLVALAKEENHCRSRIKQIAQERAKVLGVVDKYKIRDS